MQALILAGGKGTRLRPLTYSIPKSLLPIGQKPILEIIIERLRDNDFREIILAVEYKAELIKSYFGDGHGLDVNISYFQENRYAGTASPIKRAQHLLNGEPFVTMNGDLLTDLNFSKMYQAHLDESSELTIAATTYTVTLPYGVIDTQGDRIVSIREKPDVKFLINAGIYILSLSALDVIPEDDAFDMPDVIQAFIDQGREVRAYFIDGEWQDLGTLESYERANRGLGR